jgi:hypothetical protein
MVVPADLRSKMFHKGSQLGRSSIGLQGHVLMWGVSAGPISETTRRIGQGRAYTQHHAVRVKKMNATLKRTCHACNKTFSKAEHLTRHLRSHTKERPYECSVCGKLYSRRLNVHSSHRFQQADQLLSMTYCGGMKKVQNDSPQAREQSATESLLTPLSQRVPKRPAVLTASPGPVPEAPARALAIGEPHNISTPTVTEMNLHDPILHADSSAWFLGASLVVDALDFSLSSAI